MLERYQCMPQGLGSGGVMRRYRPGRPAGTVAAGYPNLAASFNNSPFLSRASNAALAISGLQSFSIAAWVNPTATTGSNEAIVSKYDNGPNQKDYMLFLDNSSVPSFFVSSDGSALDEVQWGSALTLGTWCFVVVTYDSTLNQIGISVNAGTAATAGHTGGIHSSAAPFAIGTAFNNSPVSLYLCNGKIDEVGFWNKALSAAERTTLYNAGVGLTSSDLTGSLLTNVVSWWPLNEATGATTWPDAIGTNTLTATGTVTSVAGIR